MTITIGALVSDLKSQFEAAGLTEPSLDARRLVCLLLDVSLTDLVLHADRILAEEDVELVRSAATRRCRREPVHRIVSRRSFFSLELVLSPETLEPRSDTETLVSAALPIARAAVSENGTCSIVDLGTGSGAICLALLAEVDGATGFGTDISKEALDTARKNAERNDLAGRFSTSCGSWFEAVDGTFDVIVSNPPYIPTADIEALEPEVRDFDPLAALDGGLDGLDAYRAIAAGADEHLALGGHIIVETGYDQHEAVIGLFQGLGFDCISRIQDLGGNDRVLIFTRKRVS
ncbi:MAG: peptide chain release factor N(5)-glutamine methyltransferase [Hyphomicrobiales bacterium]|nr:peptide chain release factor N(5)-glutamine methyltransferase [Hyphomicrobiales bacterium]MCP4999355.1 peptide chain release factor N(5)-glutamine methyltransferase [Hyphomicrobiales bacterium]